MVDKLRAKNLKIKIIDPRTLNSKAIFLIMVDNLLFD